jgi:hypothetical protein
LTRILNCGPPEFRDMGGEELLEAIRSSEGRTVMAEILHPAPPLVDGVSNAALAVAFGADLLLLNKFDGDGLGRVKASLGRPVGVNVEPSGEVEAHRRASRENLSRLREADFLVVTANPDARVDAGGLLDAVRTARESLPGTPVFCGRMHGSGGSGMPAASEVERLAEAADAVLVPAPGTVPGSRESEVAELVRVIRAQGALAVAAVGTSQEGADSETVREISLSAKRAGVDVVHLGDAGLGGVADPENLLAASLAIRGRRHTYRRMAMR